MVKGHLSACGLHGYSLVGYILTGPSIKTFSFKLLLLPLFASSNVLSCCTLHISKPRLVAVHYTSCCCPLPKYQHILYLAAIVDCSHVGSATTLVTVAQDTPPAKPADILVKDQQQLPLDLANRLPGARISQTKQQI